MNVTKNPAIASLEPGNLCSRLYSELYSQFFNAQERKDAEHPWGVEEGDGVSIRLHNAAYGFAYAIAGAVDGGGEGGNGGILLEYLRRDGSDMTGMFRANYGFEAGQENKALLQTYLYPDSAGIRFNEDIDVWGGIRLAGERVIGYDPDRNTLELSAGIVDLGAGSLKSTGCIVVGDSGTGVAITPSGITIGDNAVYHRGNANLPAIDWAMKDASVAGSLAVSGGVTLSGPLKALHGAELGTGGRTMMILREDDALMNGHLSLGWGYGIRIDGYTVLGRTGGSDIMLGGAGGDLLLGGAYTNRVRLLSPITDTDGDYTLLTPYGGAHFPDSLTVRHNYGEALLSSYRVDSADEGVVIHKRLRFGDPRGAYLCAQNNGVSLKSFFEYTEYGTSHRVDQDTIVRYGASTSLLAPKYRTVGSLIIETQADSVLFDKPVEAKRHLGIAGSLTRLAAGTLFFTDDIRLAASADGIKHHGNARFLGDIGSELFSPGFAGGGWAIQRNPTTGNIAATVDELTVRKRMRIYELEIQRASVTDGALWISHSCRGDSVKKVK
ncbi:MAG: hypothetical protein LBU98_02370 [Alistipes sp.]|jgi:hypothetical protein|nr:hypothetical protein [Alistipes sp.]